MKKGLGLRLWGCHGVHMQERGSHGTMWGFERDSVGREGLPRVWGA